MSIKLAFEAFESFKLSGPSWEETLEAMKDMTPDEILEQGAKHGSIEVVQYALDKGAVNKNYALIVASRFNHIEMVKLLLDANLLKTRSLQRYINIAFREASYNGYTEIVKLLLDAGADVHSENDYALHWASFNGHIEVVKVLLDAGANISEYALRYAGLKGHTEVVKILKDHIAKQSMNESFKLSGPSWEETLEAMEDIDPDEILILGAQNDSTKVIQYALDRGADIEKSYCSAIRWASFKENKDALDLLLRHINRVSYETAVDTIRIAKFNCHDEIVKIFKEYIDRKY